MENYPYLLDTAGIDWHSTSYCPRKALLFAELSGIAQLDETMIQALLRPFGDVTYISEGNAQCFVFVTDEFAAVSFRGTEPNLRDILTDIDVRKKELWFGCAHSGFLSYTHRLAAPICRVLESDRNFPLYACGHSLGAAAATLLPYIIRELHTVHQCWVYGSPRVVDEALADTYGFSMQRFSVVGDPVTCVPSALRFDHVGMPNLIDDGKVLRNMSIGKKWLLSVKNLFDAFRQARLLRHLSGIGAKHDVHEYYIPVLLRSLMNDHIERMKQELTELKGNHDKARDFLFSDKRVLLDGNQLGKLRSQVDCMNQYMWILQERIDYDKKKLSQ